MEVYKEENNVITYLFWKSNSGVQRGRWMGVQRWGQEDQVRLSETSGREQRPEVRQ